VFSTTVAGFDSLGVVVVGVAGVSAASVLSVGVGSFCDFRGVDPLPLCPLDPRLLPLPPLPGLGFVVVALVLVVATEADIVQGGLSELEEAVAY